MDRETELAELCFVLANMIAEHVAGGRPVPGELVAQWRSAADELTRLEAHGPDLN